VRQSKEIGLNVTFIVIILNGGASFFIGYKWLVHILLGLHMS
jgi:hypothetical protein